MPRRRHSQACSPRGAEGHGGKPVPRAPPCWLRRGPLLLTVPAGRGTAAGCWVPPWLRLLPRRGATRASLLRECVAHRHRGGTGGRDPCAVRGGGSAGRRGGAGTAAPTLPGVLRCSPPSPAWLRLAWPRYLRVPWGACGCPRETPWPCPPSSWLLHSACGSGAAPVQAGEIKDCAQRRAGSFFPRWHGVLGWLLQWDVGGPQHCECACGNPHGKGPAQSWGGDSSKLDPRGITISPRGQPSHVSPRPTLLAGVPGQGTVVSWSLASPPR